MSGEDNKGLVNQLSQHSVDETVKRLKEILWDRDITLFAVIDHSGEAAKVGMEMPPTKLLIFGNPRAGTPIMQTSPSAAIDLPLKMLVAQGSDDRVWISWNDPEYLRHRHGFSAELVANLAGAAKLAAAAGE